MHQMKEDMKGIQERLLKEMVSSVTCNIRINVVIVKYFFKIKSDSIMFLKSQHEEELLNVRKGLQSLFMAENTKF